MDSGDGLCVEAFDAMLVGIGKSGWTVWLDEEDHGHIAASVLLGFEWLARRERATACGNGNGSGQLVVRQVCGKVVSFSHTQSTTSRRYCFLYIATSYRHIDGTDSIHHLFALHFGIRRTLRVDSCQGNPLGSFRAKPASC